MSVIEEELRVISTVEKWRRPTYGWTSIIVDAAIFYDLGAISSIRRNHLGQLTGANVRNYPHICVLAVLEVLAIREALSWVKDRGLSHVVIESDCLLAVKTINNNEVLNSNYGLLIFYYRDVLATLVDVQVVFTRRSVNLTTHNLVRIEGSTLGFHV